MVFRRLCGLIALLALFACSQDPPAGGYADVLFVGENIVTMDPENAEADAVAIRGDSIVYVGDRQEAMSFAGPDTRIEELVDRALIPGLIDTHGHFPFTARLLSFVNLSSPPVGTVNSIDDIVDQLRKNIAVNEKAPGTWVLGYGYDDSLLAENRHPTRNDLDRASTKHPVGLMHVSGHLAAANSAALAAAGIDASSSNPAGGVIRRHAGTQKPNGVLEETAAFAIVGRLATAGQDDLETQMRAAAIYYASFGITTAQDGAANPDDIQALASFAANRALAIDVAAYPVVNQYPLEAIKQVRHNPDYAGGFRVAGAKLTLDGSPQGRTAWLTEPYEQGPEGADASYVAYPTIDPEQYKSFVGALIENGVPVIVHANGDAAMDLMIDGVDAALEGKPSPDHRSVIIHAQLMRVDQLDRAKDLGLVPSFFSAHTFFWGDWHRLSFGDQRALNISPVRWAIDRNVPFTVHNDAPVVPPDMMRLLWATVNRKTRSEFVLGEDQRATPYEALYAMTQGAAYQYFEEDSKGSITQGKRADLVILDNNPLTAEPDTLKDITVLETIARGKTVFELK